MVNISDQELKHLKLLAAAVDQTLDGVAFCDPQCQLLYVNNAFAEMHGYSPDELIGKNISFLHNAEQKPQVDAAVNQVKATGRFAGLVWRVHRNGTAFPSQVNITVFRDPKGIVLGIIAIVRDMTAQLQAEMTLRQREKQLAILYENVNDVVFYLDVEPKEHYRFSFVNPAFVKATGLKDSQVVGKLVSEVIPEPSLSLVLANYRQAIQNKALVCWEEITPYPSGDKTGEVAVAPIFNEQGICTNLVGTVHDVTEHKQIEESLTMMTRKYDAILKADPDIIMEVDNNKVYTYANQAGYEFFGGDVIGKEAAAYFVGEQKVYQAVAPLFKGSEGVIYIESWQRRKDGEKRLLAWWCRTLKDANGNVKGALSTARDITEQKKSEEDLRATMNQLKLVNEVAVGNELKAIEREGKWTACSGSSAAHPNTNCDRG